MKVAKDIGSPVYTEPIEIIENYFIVEDNYDFSGNTREDVTSFETLNAFFGFSRISYKLFRDSLVTNILPTYNSLSTPQKKNLIYNRVYPDTLTPNDIIAIVGQLDYDTIINTKTEYEFIEDTNTSLSGYTATTAPNTYLSKVEFDVYSGSTDISGKLDTTTFNTYTGTTAPNTYLGIAPFNVYSGNTLSNINNKLNTSDFNTYSGNTSVLINNNSSAITDNDNDITYLSGATDNNTSAIEANDVDINYLSGQTDTKLNISDFNTYSGNTSVLINNKLDVFDFNIYSGNTNVLINNKLDIFDFNIYSGNTSVLINNNTLAIDGNEDDIFYISGETSANSSAISDNDNDISYLSGQTSGKLNTSDFNTYSGVTQSQINAKANLSSPTFTGTPAAPTASVNTNTTQLATTAFVVGQAANVNPLINGSVALGTSLRYARQDHVHPTDTTRAPLASPSLTGTPTAPTASVGTSTTQLATTAFVIGQAANTLPIINGTATIGTSTRYARQDHIHATDTTRAPLASPAFTGTPTAPTASIGTSTTQLATTAFVTNTAVYGSQFQLVESNGNSTSSATTPQTKVSMTTSNLPAGTYKIFAKWRFTHSSQANSALFDLTLNGTPIGVQTPISIEIKDTSDVVPYTTATYQALSGVNTILLRYWNESNSTTISDAAIELIRVS